MRRRYDLRRSDNYPYTGKVSYVCRGNGILKVWTGFPVTSAIVSWATVPWDIDRGYSSSSSVEQTSVSSSSSEQYSSSSSTSTEIAYSTSSESSTSISSSQSSLPSFKSSSSSQSSALEWSTSSSQTSLASFQSSSSSSSSSSSGDVEYFARWETTTGSPDAIGNFVYHSQYNGYPAYVRTDGSYYLFLWDPISINVYAIDPILNEDPPLWTNFTGVGTRATAGQYQPFVGGTQNITVTEGFENLSSSSSESTSATTSSSSSSDSTELSSSSSDSSLTSEETSPIYDRLPRLYVFSYLIDGFNVAYENISPDLGFIEFNYSAS